MSCEVFTNYERDYRHPNSLYFLFARNLGSLFLLRGKYIHCPPHSKLDISSKFEYHKNN